MLTYKDAGVDKEAGYREVELIKELVRSTHNAGSVSDIGGFAGLYRPDFSGMKDPLLVSGTDGVGTKLQMAYMMDRHDTIGIDLVAMCVNDILCVGAKPLFFLDYIATGELIAEKMASVVKGVAAGCIEAGCALIGGETAEMPGIYRPEHYDLAGFAVGIVDREKMLTGETIKPGDVILGLRSSGVHSNGYSLVRKIIFGVQQFTLDKPVAEFGSSLGEELLKPTRIYVELVSKLLAATKIKGISHITGGGLYENLPRILPQGMAARLDFSAYQLPAVFTKLKEWGHVDIDEMFHTFNMGIGMCLVLAPEDVAAAQAVLAEAGESAILLGEVVAGEGVELCQLNALQS